MSLELYFFPLSQPSRSIQALLLLGKVQFTPKVIDLMKGEHLTPEYAKVSPTQAVPAIVDGDFKLFESHAILRYIVAKHKLNDFYSQDPQQAALIESYLDWHHTGTRKIALFSRDFVLGPKYMNKPAPENREERLKEVSEILKFFEHVFLGEGKFTNIFNQPKPSIADLSAIMEIVGLFSFNFDFTPFPGIQNYVKHMLAIQEIKQVNGPMISMLQGAELNDFIKSQI